MTPAATTRQPDYLTDVLGPHSVILSSRTFSEHFGASVIKGEPEKILGEPAVTGASRGFGEQGPRPGLSQQYIFGERCSAAGLLAPSRSSDRQSPELTNPQPDLPHVMNFGPAGSSDVLCAGLQLEFRQSEAPACEFDACDWLEHFIATADLAGFDDAQKLVYACLHHEGEAFRWYRVHSQDISCFADFEQQLSTEVCTLGRLIGCSS